VEILLALLTAVWASISLQEVLEFSSDLGQRGASGISTLWFISRYHKKWHIIRVTLWRFPDSEGAALRLPRVLCRELHTYTASLDIENVSRCSGETGPPIVPRG
jgi:hypothetical protein